MRILSLGDSYTIGESVAPCVIWPMQLANRLKARGTEVADPLIIAQTGWTTGDLLDGLTHTCPTGPFELVTLLIGVNNQYQGSELAEYRVQFKILLERSITLAGDQTGRVVVLSIPDWGVTPFAGGRDQARIAAAIDSFNAINRAEAAQAGAWYVDVTSISRRSPNHPTWIAGDGLHPSAEMYALWVDKILRVV